MKYIYTFLVALITACAVVLVMFNTPAEWYNLQHFFETPRFGSAFTTLSSTNVISAFPTTYNSNLAVTANTSTSNTFSGANIYTALNSFQANASTTGLSVYGASYFGATATSSFSSTGVLTLISALTAPNGGTGSTTLSANELFVGNGTGNVLSVGWGTTGQVLTSNGAGAIATWGNASIDQTANYNFTGTVLIKNLNASSTAANPIVLNGLSFNIPSLRSASSTVLSEDGSGNLTFEQPFIRVLLDTAGTALTTSNTSSTTITTLAVAANTFGSNVSLEGKMLLMNPGSAACSYDLNFGSGAATTTVFSITLNSNSRIGFYDIAAFATSSASGVFLTQGPDLSSGGAAYPGPGATFIGQTASVGFNFAAITYLAVIGRAVAGGTCNLEGLTIKAVRS